MKKPKMQAALRTTFGACKSYSKVLDVVAAFGQRALGLAVLHRPLKMSFSAFEFALASMQGWR